MVDNFENYETNWVSVRSKKCPIGSQLAYKWYRQNLYPELLIKIGGKIFISLSEWERMVDLEIQKNIERKINQDIPIIRDMEVI